MNLRNRLSKIRRIIFEIFGVSRYSRPALNDIDRKLEQYLDFKEGFFIEAGANDGYIQSNTYYLEKIKSWSGILIEPLPLQYERCVKERKKSIVFNCALVPFDYRDDNVKMLYSNLMSVVQGARKTETLDQDHVIKGAELQSDVDDIYSLTVPARTLTSILNEVGVEAIDFFSLDVEGYEIDVLKGLDFDKYRPKFILIEQNFPEEIGDFLTSIGYDELDRLSDKDILYKVNV
jgi:FkbM family methyltransferase